MIYFNEDRHEYRVDDKENGEIYISATTLLGLFKTFDEKYWKYYTALRRALGMEKKEFSKFLIVKFRYDFNKQGTTEEKIGWLRDIARQCAINEDQLLNDIPEVSKEWKATSLIATDKGTKFHLDKENEVHSNGGGEFDGVFHKVVTEAHDLSSLAGDSPVIIPELRMYNRRYKVAGSADMIKIFPDKKVNIDDWKGFSLDTPIATKTGWKNIGDILVGDEIFDGNGKITKVKNVSQVHYNPCYKIIFDTKDELVCDHEHKWVITLPKQQSFYEKEMTTEDVYKHFTEVSKNMKINCVSLELPDVELPLDPYVLGVWLGDGNRCYPTISNMNQKIWKEIEHRGYKIGEDISKGGSGKAETKTVYGISKILRDLDLVKNKHIPDIYMRSSHKQRLDLLRGFMDADGYFHRSRKRCVMDTTRTWQVQALTELTSSLGFKPVTFPFKGRGFGKDNIQMYSVCFSPVENPFLCRNEDYNEVMGTVNKERSKYRYIKSIERVATVPTKCLEVESETHTYLAGKNLIKTHNTNKEIKMVNKFQKMKFPLEHLDDCNHVHYCLQVSLYAYMLEQFGYKPNNLKFTHVVLDPDDETVILEQVEYHSSYLKKEVISMLNYYEQNKEELLKNYKKS